mgnify:CR=1 FL=1
MPELYDDLTEGWNLIGTKPSETGADQTISELKEELSGKGMEIIDATIWMVNSNNEYERVTGNLQPGRGYWIKLKNV